MNAFRTPLQIKLNFTVEQALYIQAMHLKEYEAVLQKPVHEMLQQLVTASNKDAVDGFDVVRGNEIDVILHNQIIPLFANPETVAQQQQDTLQKRVQELERLLAVSEDNYKCLAAHHNAECTCREIY
jgi:hypothetical protein